MEWRARINGWAHPTQTGVRAQDAERPTQPSEMARVARRVREADFRVRQGATLCRVAIWPTSPSGLAWLVLGRDSVLLGVATPWVSRPGSARGWCAFWVAGPRPGDEKAGTHETAGRQFGTSPVERLAS